MEDSEKEYWKEHLELQNRLREHTIRILNEKEGLEFPLMIPIDGKDNEFIEHYSDGRRIHQIVCYESGTIVRNEIK